MTTTNSNTKSKSLGKGTTPKGIASFSFLNRPDDYKGKKAYKTTLTLTGDDAAPLIASIDAASDKVFADTKALLNERIEAAATGKDKKKFKDALEALKLGKPYAESVDEEGDGNGSFDFKFKCGAEYKDAKTRILKQIKLSLFDASNPPKPTAAAIWGGSELKVAYSLFPYFVDGTGVCGITLRMEGVQVIKLVSGGGDRSASAFGFGGEDGGYSAPDSENEEREFEDTGTLPSAGPAESTAGDQF